MPSKPTIESWLPDAIQAFNKVLPAPDVSYVIVIKSKEEAVINELKNTLDVPSSLGRSDNWAGLTLPRHKGTAIVIRQYGLHGKTDFKHYLWHEMGHAFAFANESPTPFWNKPTPAYMLWAEFIADTIGFSVSRANGNPLPLTPIQHLAEAFKGNKIHVGSIGHFCSEVQYTAVPSNTPAPIIGLSEMLREKLRERDYWKIDQQWLDKIMEQLELLRR